MRLKLEDARSLSTEQYFRKLLGRLAEAFSSEDLMDYSTQDFQSEIEAALELPEAESPIALPPAPTRKPRR